MIKRIKIESQTESEKASWKEDYIKFVEGNFRHLTPKIVDYKKSKTDKYISTIRHGFNLLQRNKEWKKLRRDIIKEKDFCNIDNDLFTDAFTEFLVNISSEEIIRKIEISFEALNISSEYKVNCENIVDALKIYFSNFDNTIDFIRNLCNEGEKESLNKIIEGIRLYKIEAPFVANASNYGVPQNRERVLFIGCRKDQKFIADIPATVTLDEKVSIFEALYDLDFLGNNEEAHRYQNVNISQQYNGTAKKMEALIKHRAIDGKTLGKKGKTYAEWSKEGRLIERYKKSNKPFYVKSAEALKKGEKNYDISNNHKTSNQGEDVLRRLKIILEEGDYKEAKTRLEENGLSSNKRNYNVLKPEKQSPTVMTIPDDYIVAVQNSVLFIFMLSDIH